MAFGELMGPWDAVGTSCGNLHPTVDISGVIKRQNLCSAVFITFTPPPPRELSLASELDE